MQQPPGAAPGHGAVLCEPPASSWRALAAHNAAALDASRVHVGAVALGELRAAARPEILELAASTLARWGDPAPRAGPGPLLVTGHQPLLFHPGIWVKHVLVAAAVASGGTGLGLIVDCDEAGALDVPVPRRGPRLSVARRRLGAAPAGVPFEAAPPPAARDWERFIATVRADLATLGQPELLGRLDELDRAGRALVPASASLGDFVARLRRGVEQRAGAPCLHELPVSRLSQSRAFRAFAAALCADFERLWEAHNRALGAHRRGAGIRNAAWPWPDLREREGWLELPLWAVRQGRREAVFARRQGKMVILRVATQPELARLDGPCVAVDAGLRPRALVLTMFARLCLGDLFVHGTGGGRYDLATDAVMRELFAMEPPAFAVASATFPLPLGPAPDVTAELDALRRLLADLDHCPARHIDPAEPRQRALAAERRQIAAALASRALSPADRAAAARRLRALRSQLAAALAARRREIEGRLGELRARAVEHRAATLREYPLFLFDLVALRAAVALGAG
ncbi:MAG: hypothetical protein HY744_07680 [Deltaproteobacteria bacterium]|nr:hypothetical protein [Deltaproteobacteria bacterium]